MHELTWLLYVYLRASRSSSFAVRPRFLSKKTGIMRSALIRAGARKPNSAIAALFCATLSWGKTYFYTSTTNARTQKAKHTKTSHNSENTACFAARTPQLPSPPLHQPVNPNKAKRLQRHQCEKGIRQKRVLHDQIKSKAKE